MRRSQRGQQYLAAAWPHTWQAASGACSACAGGCRPACCSREAMLPSGLLLSLGRAGLRSAPAGANGKETSHRQQEHCAASNNPEVPRQARSARLKGSWHRLGLSRSESRKKSASPAASERHDGRCAAATACELSHCAWQGMRQCPWRAVQPLSFRWPVVTHSSAIMRNRKVARRTGCVASARRGGSKLLLPIRAGGGLGSAFSWCGGFVDVLVCLEALPQQSGQNGGQPVRAARTFPHDDARHGRSKLRLPKYAAGGLGSAFSWFCEPANMLLCSVVLPQQCGENGGQLRWMLQGRCAMRRCGRSELRLPVPGTARHVPLHVTEPSGVLQWALWRCRAY